MIHPPSRRESADQSLGVARVAEPSPAPAPDEVASVPRQATGAHHPDAYDLYAQIYALRTDLPGDRSG
jgi:hypothetical protein